MFMKISERFRPRRAVGFDSGYFSKKISWRQGWREELSTLHTLRWVQEVYTVSQRECGQFRPYVHEDLEIFQDNSTPTGSWWASGAIESNCRSGSKLSWIFQNFHEHRDGTVHTLDGTQYRNKQKHFWDQIHIVTSRRRSRQREQNLRCGQS